MVTLAVLQNFNVHHPVNLRNKKIIFYSRFQNNNNQFFEKSWLGHMFFRSTHRDKQSSWKMQKQLVIAIN
jgi:hypothetical protein